MSLHILDLPVDILVLILTPLLIQPHPIPLCPCGTTEDFEPSTNININPLPILLIHPAIHAIATPLFYQGNQFILDIRLKHATHVRRYLDDQIEDASYKGLIDDDVMVLQRKKELLGLQNTLRRIRVLEIRILKLRGWIDERIVPLVRDMIVSGSLGELCVRIYSFSVTNTRERDDRDEGTSSSSGSSSMFMRPPLSGLLGLLSDPYLQTARLWVSAAAAESGAWRPFRLLCSEGEGEVIRGDGDGLEDGLVGIDWGRIVRTVDPGGEAAVVLGGKRI